MTYQEIKEKISRKILCRFGFHKEYYYMPKVSGDMGEDKACKRCGYGQRLDGSWSIEPEKVQKATSQQAEIEWSNTVSFLAPFMPDFYRQVTTAYEMIKNNFTESELEKVTKKMANIEKIHNG